MSEYRKRSRGDKASKSPRKRAVRRGGSPRPAIEAAGEMAPIVPEAEDWRDSLNSMQKSINNAAGAMDLLRTTLQELAPVWRDMSRQEYAPGDAGRADTRPRPIGAEPAAPELPPAIEAEAVPAEPAARKVAHPPDAAAVAAKVVRRLSGAHTARQVGAGSEVHSYTITVEDTQRKVDLVPLHRALRSVPGVRDLSLLGYTNGIATIALDGRSGLEASALEVAIADTTNRQCRIWERSADTFLVRVGA